MTDEQQQRNLMLAAALESGEFKQCTGQLRKSGQALHCCLGVACELYRRQTGDGEWDVDEFTIESSDSKTFHDDLPPAQVGEWYGWGAADSDPIIPTSLDGVSDERCASEWNDGGAKFPAIAAGFRLLVQEDA